MSSHSGSQLRRVPQQQRGEQRVAGLLSAAADEIAAVGYEAATMCAIAERAGAPIGSLYQFFPNKMALVQALRTQQGKDYEELLVALESAAKNLSLKQLAGRLIRVSAQFIECHPAFLHLLDAPPSTRSPLSLRRLLRERLANCIAVVEPGTSWPVAMRVATVTLQIVKGLCELYGEESVSDRKRLISEYSTALTCYWTARLETRSGASGNRPHKR